MLQSLRDNMKGTLAMIVIGLMIIPFALFGVDSLFLQDGSAGNAAEVNGEKISEVDLSRAVRNQKQQLLQRYGEQAPVELLSDENLREPVLNRLIQREIVQQSAASGGMTVADKQLDQLIVLSPQFQQNGKFSPELYTQLLRSSGFTPASYKELLTQDIVLRQHISGITDTAFVTATDLQALIGLTQQKRSFEYITLPQSEARKGIEISDTAVQEFYNDNQAQFMSNEMVAIEYIELSLENLADAIEVSDADIEQQYQENMKSFEGDTLRQAAHILIETKSDGSEQSVIEELTSKLEGGEDFSELAKAYSDDFGSREVGGDLGVTDGSTFPDTFEAALAALSVGEVSGPVTTDAGVHFIKLLSEQKAEAPSLDESRDQIREEIALAEADSQFVELLDRLPEATYNSEDLTVSADELGLEVVTSDYFDREGGEGITQNNQVLALAFSDELLAERQVSDLIEIGNDHVLVLRVADHKPSAVKPLAQVRDQIIETLIRAQAAEKLKEHAVELQQRIGAGQSVAEIAADQDLQWQAAIGINRAQAGYAQELVAFVFEQPKPVDGAVIGHTELANGDYAVVKLTAAEAGAMPELQEAQQLNLTNTVNQQAGDSELSLFELEKREASEVTIY